MRVVCLLLVAVIVAIAQARLDRFDTKVVPSGTIITKLEGGDLKFEYPDKSTHHYKPKNTTVKGDPDGWRSSMWSWGTAYTYFAAKFTVPPAPTNTNGQCLFWFPSFQHEGSGSVDILQPVLQYNCNGHSGWTMASWYGSTQYVQSDSVQVNPGDQIVGAIISSNGNWYIESFHSGNNSPFTSLTINPGGNNGVYFQPHNSAQVALEVYGVKSCDMYPNANSFVWSDLALQDQGNWVTPSWSQSNNPTSCGVSSSCPASNQCVTTWNA